MTATVAPKQDRAAALISDIAGPIPVAVALFLAGVHDGRTPSTAILWGLLAVLLVAVVPYAVTRRARHPPDGPRPTRRRKGVYMAAVAGTAAIGLVVLWLLPSPPALRSVALSVIGALIATAVATAVAGWSNHTAACAGGVALCVALDGPDWLVLGALVVAVGWARYRLGRHSVGELVGGMVVGAAASAVMLELLL